MNQPPPAIPLIDVRDGGPPEHARRSASRARALRDACLEFFPRPLLPALPVLDYGARRALQRSRSPYLAEIARIAEILEFSGVWLLNGCYQWACTSLIREQSGLLWLIRTLDWPFRGLGRYVDVAQMRGCGGDFFSITWPGYVGALTAIAPFRFAACLNQAPMRRRTVHAWLRPFDFTVNALASRAHPSHMPPDQLLRRVFETCKEYGSARRMLETSPIARPAIFSLAGAVVSERCIIERTESGFATREGDTCAANDWTPQRPGWEARIGPRRFLTISFAEAGDSNRARREALAGWRGSLAQCSFDWVQEPVLNPYTRLAAAMCPAKGILRLIGYDDTGAALPEPVTQACEIALSPSLRPA